MLACTRWSRSVSERVAEDELEPFPHEPLAREGLERVVAEVGVAEWPVEDLAQPEVADDRAVVVPTDHEAGVVRPAVADELVERLAGSPADTTTADAGREMHAPAAGTPPRRRLGSAGCARGGPA